MEKTKKEIVIIGLILLIALIGVSYAAFRFIGEGTKLNTITTGSITMTYEESDNTISLTGALPTTDATGKTRLNDGEYFDFTVSSNISGDVNINYEISAKKEDGNTIGGEYIKLYLTRLTDDGEEEALMVPETYNEETSANDYTGRPANEMSLYTSSMNSSESTRYRLRMWVDESYNPQGDGGNLQFSVQINVNGKDGEKGSDVPLTTQKILEDNELQEEKENMFNYASNGNYLDMSSSPQNNPEYVTNGLYSIEDEDGTSYYFRGNVNNNNVQFGEYTSDYYVYQGNNTNIYQSESSCTEAGNSSCTQVKLASARDKMYWKIIRINGDGSLRLIYNGTSANPDNSDLAHSYVVGVSPYNLEYNDSKYTGYTYDNGTDSFIKKEVDTWYKNTLGSSGYDSKVIGGRFCSDSSGYRYDEIIDGNVFSSYDRLAQSDTNYAKPNAPVLNCPSTSEIYGGSYRLKAGLITADELVLAGENPGVTTDSYLSLGKSAIEYWSMTPTAFNGGYAYVWYEYDGLADNRVDDIRAVRPVINVTTENGFTSGDGTASSPYTISE